MSSSRLPRSPRGLRVAIACPRGSKTGGPEALHQLFGSLLQTGVDAFLVSTSNSQNSVADYQKYNPIWKDFENLRDVDYLVVPETIVELPDSWERVFFGKVVIWWLSVDYSPIPEARSFETRSFPLSPEWDSGKSVFDLTLRVQVVLGKIRDSVFERFARLARTNSQVGDSVRLNIGDCTHIAQSIYAQRWLREFLDQESHLVSDYIWVNGAVPNQHRKSGVHKPLSDRTPVVAFNPAKGGDLVNLVRRQADRSIRWVALEGMSGQEIFGTLKKADLYLDLGHFPGRDRIPREAALASCPVLLAKRGSARYQEDFLLDGYYLLDLEHETPKSVAKRVEAIVASRDLHLMKQRPFAEIVNSSKSRFLNEVLAWVESLKVRGGTS